MLVFGFLMFLSISTIEAQPNFNEDIGEIIYNKCSVCHRQGEIGPMPFESYEDVANRSNLVKYVTGIGYMPPWQADPEYSHFLGENFLTQLEIDKIAEWVDNGSPRGPSGAEPAFPDFPTGSVLGTPDLVLSFDQSYTHLGNNQDNYRYFVLPSGLTEDRIIKAIELRPGNTKIVHHCLFFEDTTGEAAQRDAATPEYGFDGFGGFNGNDQASILNNKQYPGYVPGQKPRFYPEGLGQVLRAGSDLVIQMHYAPWPVNEQDSSTVNIFFADASETIEREVETHIMVPLPGVLTNGPFFLQAEDVKRFRGEWIVPRKISFVGISPHMHLLGQEWEVYLEHQDGTRTNMISIPEWDFNWQGMYNFPRYIVAEEGDKIVAFATYDNTSENPNNPNNPPQFVTWGEGTTDEMYYLPLSFVDYNDGDEDIVFAGGTTSVDEVFEVEKDAVISSISPNPAQDYVELKFSVKVGGPLNITILNVDGQVIRKLRKGEFFAKGEHIIHFNAETLTAGNYLLRLDTGSSEIMEQFIKIAN